MKGALGVGCLAGGAMLILWGHNMAHSVGGQLKFVFTGSPGDKPMYLYASGAAVGAIGLYLLFFGRKR